MKKIGLCWGVWDLFHIGHLNLLKRAKEYCDTLVVCVSTNDYVLKYKGHETVIPLKERMEIIKALKVVDIVDVQSLSFGKKEAIIKYNPNELYVGDDHLHDFTGEGFGIPVVYLQYTKGISSTILRKKMGLK